MIHETAIIHPKAEIGEGTTIGPYSIIGEHVRMGKNNRIAPHVVIEGRTEMGDGNQVFQFASLGSHPQSKGYNGEKTRLNIGNDNTFREYVTVNIGTAEGAGVTRVGNGNMLMNHAHLGHDCQIGNNNILVNSVGLAGHVEMGDYNVIGGLAAFHQFVRLGSYCMISGGSMVVQDVPPYCIAQGDRATLRGINQIGLRRNDFSRETIGCIKKAYRFLFCNGLALKEAIEKGRKRFSFIPEVKTFIDFIEASKRGITRPKTGIGAMQQRAMKERVGATWQPTANWDTAP